MVAMAALACACSRAAPPSPAVPVPAAAEPGLGPQPALPRAQRQLVPTVNIAPARPWPAGQRPVAAPGLAVQAFAMGLDHPRWLHVLPNGDVLVAESNAPARPEDDDGLKGKAMKLVMKRAGAAVPSADRITLLRDADGDGVAELRSVLLQGLRSPFGMALVGERLYIANTDAVVWVPYRPGDTRITAAPQTLAPLPAGPRNHHWTKALLASADGRQLYATVGSNSNVAEHGLAEEEGRAAIWQIDRETGRARVFATGLRNPNGMGWGPDGALWTVVNERDELGDHLVPDYLTPVKDGGFYGWPWSYFGSHVDERVKPPRPDQVARALKPDYALGSHVAPLGLAFSRPEVLGGRYPVGAFVGLHGSWNRSDLAGYKVVFVPFEGAAPAPGAQPQDVLTGFLSPDGDAWGRPVGVALDGRGGLLVADDVGNAVWRVAPASPAR
ncbi:MAG: sorbosone dehydrogenase family protein [Burkholderiales bacterium]|nr:sorbosone dehydrogenase family protein [Burkholderiales bacterium]